MKSKQPAPIGGTTAGVNPHTGNTQPVFGQGAGNDKTEGGRYGAKDPNGGTTFSSHPGHGSAKRTIAGEKSG